MRKVLAVLWVFLAACGGDGGGATEPPIDTRPANVTIVSATWKGVYWDGERITVSFRNQGGPGYFKLNVSATASTTPNGPLADFGSTEPFEVTAGWTQTADFTATTGASAGVQRARRLTVYSRGKTDISYTKTGEFVFP